MLIALRRILIVIAFLAVGLLAGDLAMAVDDLPAPAADPSKRKFPLDVRLLGYVRGPKTVSALVKIGDETFTLKRGEIMPVLFEHATEAAEVEFEDFNERKREVRLGFPGSPYAAKECAMKRPGGPKTL